MSPEKNTNYHNLEVFAGRNSKLAVRRPRDGIATRWEDWQVKRPQHDFRFVISASVALPCGKVVINTKILTGNDNRLVWHSSETIRHPVNQA